MKLLMTTDCVGGVWSYSMTLCRGLAAFDVAVTLAVTGGEMSDAQRGAAAALGNVELHGRPYKCEWMQPPLADVEAAGAWLDELADAARPDVVHLNDFALGSRGFGKAKKVVVAHSNVIDWFRDVRFVEADEAWNDYTRAVAHGLADADAVVALTRGGCRSLRYSFGYVGRPHVIYNAVDPVPAESPEPPREPFVLAAGRLWDEAKGLHLLAKAAAGCPWPVKLAGEAEHPDGGRARFDNVEVLGPLPHDSLRALMRRAGLFVAVPRYEPFGLTVAEAAAAGCPLLLSGISTLQELWTDAAVFVDVTDERTDHVASLREVMNRLIDDTHERCRLALAARARASRYTPKVQAQRYVELYGQLLEEGK